MGTDAGTEGSISGNADAGLRLRIDCLSLAISGEIKQISECIKPYTDWFVKKSLRSASDGKRYDFRLSFKCLLPQYGLRGCKNI